MKTFAINGNWIEDEDHPGHSQAFQFGAGLFETIRIQGGEPLFWNAHMERLRTSAAELGFDSGLNIERLELWTADLIQENPQGSCALKIIWTPDADEGTAQFYFRPLTYTKEQRTQGFTVGLGEIRRNPHSRVTAHKTLNYLDNLLEKKAARAAGFDEAILLNVMSEAAEATAANLFIQSNGILITPPLEAGILPGIQRKAILDACRREGLPIEERSISFDMMTRASGIYLSNSLMGFMPVSNFMGNCYDKDESLAGRINRLTGIIDPN